MAIPASLNKNLALPVICAPMFIISNPDLVIAQCQGGLIGSFPALNARPKEVLDAWLTRIKAELADDPQAAPFAVNQIIHQSNERLEHDMALCVKHQVPLIITSLRAPNDIAPQVHAYGGKVFHDVISVRHAGTLSPFALVGEIRKFYQGPIALSGAITNGSAILAAQAMGADFAYIGTRFIATREAHAVAAYKQAILESTAADVVYTPYFTGVHGNYLKKSIGAAGLDPDNLPLKDKTTMSFGSARDAKAWKDIWGAGQGVGTIDEVLPTATLIARLKQEYAATRERLLAGRSHE
ncbi:MAG: nitronate monooxygenase family protein [Azonexus sp.]|jgi:nitronate monooxygenase|uniref:NAD(P)H-dependent flavin oxidoreductase n=1 Tax=Azonexus sp. TaxID=1872668 RepID=UPI0028299C1F|nr:nitronate monooxygenase family protein [Azonexus sp.]MDR0775607.1 nitronate monooxygenase family protein [Azonexus sp.]